VPSRLPQGFFGPSSPERIGNNPYNGNEGNDFRRSHAVDTIDFAVAHGARLRCLRVWCEQPR
jgi:hypothetical protein